MQFVGYLGDNVLREFEPSDFSRLLNPADEIASGRVQEAADDPAEHIHVLDAGFELDALPFAERKHFLNLFRGHDSPPVGGSGEPLAKFSSMNCSTS